MKVRIALMAALGALALLAVPSVASAAFHEMKIREVYVDTVSPATDSYVVLQMHSSGQSFVTGHTVTIYDAVGNTAVSGTFAGDVASGENQSTILASINPAPSGVAADLVLSGGGIPDPAAGAACFDKIDCVAWGAFAGSPLKDDSTGAAPAFGAGQALRRDISPGCTTFLETQDDSGFNNVDFSLVTPTPRNNASEVTETTCGGGDGDNDPPKLDSYARDVQNPQGNRVAKLKGGCDEACTIRASGKLWITKPSGKKTVLVLKADRRPIDRPAQRNLFVKLSKKNAKRMHGALNKGWDVVARVRVTAIDEAGNETDEAVFHEIRLEKA